MYIVTAPTHDLYQSWLCAILSCPSLSRFRCNENTITSKDEWLTGSSYKPHSFCVQLRLKQCSWNLHSLNSLWLLSSSCVIFSRFSQNCEKRLCLSAWKNLVLFTFCTCCILICLVCIVVSCLVYIVVSCLVCIVVSYLVCIVVICVFAVLCVYCCFYFRFQTAGWKSVFRRSCDRPPRHRFFLVSLCL